MKKLISSVCFFGLVFNAWGNEQETQFEEIKSPEEQSEKETKIEENPFEVNEKPFALYQKAFADDDRWNR